MDYNSQKVMQLLSLDESSINALLIINYYYNNTIQNYCSTVFPCINKHALVVYSGEIS